MKILLLGRDLMFASRIESAAARANAELARVGDPADLPDSANVDLLLVDWADREEDWGSRLRRWRAEAPETARPTVVLFGPHVDLTAHAAARSAALGPMRARSWLLTQLPALLDRSTATGSEPHA